MATPRTPFWKAVSGTDANGNPAPQSGQWREAATDPRLRPLPRCSGSNVRPST